ncbi:MAG TPA: amino acid permease [Candidatus Hydrogenedentes bacterium]|nr:amino acid permease [Candidatus Hydrogenedentota bacterium]
MQSDEMAENQPPHHLHRRFGLLQATALNMSNMIGVGPFITIPLIMTAMGGPQAILGWFLAAVICIPDGMVWSELGAAMPGSGGTYVYLRDGFGRQTFGRLMAFIFIWQFILSGPLEIASGYIGFGRYLRYLWQDMPHVWVIGVAILVGIVNMVLLYRKISFIGKLTVTLWVGTLSAVFLVIVAGVTHFDPKVAFDFPPGAFNFSWGFLLGLGTAMRVGIYDYLGYYDVCYIGGEVKNPGRVIPYSIIISIVSVAVMYFLINLSVIGVVPWREFVPNTDHPNSDFIVSTFMERCWGSGMASIFTLMILWSTFGSVFALLLGYSRIPYAAALDGNFFGVFSKLHPRKDFPHVSLLVIGVISIIVCFMPLDVVINVLVTIRILVQFIGQIAAVHLLRRREPSAPRPYRIWFYPIPSLIALTGWIFVFITSGATIISFSLIALIAGILAFLVWSWFTKRWPFAPAESSG